MPSRAFLAGTARPGYEKELKVEICTRDFFFDTTLEMKSLI